jgi:hypothetical protein
MAGFGSPVLNRTWYVPGASGLPSAITFFVNVTLPSDVFEDDLDAFCAETDATGSASAATSVPTRATYFIAPPQSSREADSFQL